MPWSASNCPRRPSSRSAWRTGFPRGGGCRASFDVYEAAEFSCSAAIFLSSTSAALGEVAAVYDRAALIAWAPELRAPYVRHLAALVKPGTQMLLITLEYPQSQMSGPPFSLMREEVERLYSPYFTCVRCRRQDILANEPRLRSRGLKEFSEVCYHPAVRTRWSNPNSTKASTPWPILERRGAIWRLLSSPAPPPSAPATRQN